MSKDATPPTNKPARAAPQIGDAGGPEEAEEAVAHRAAGAALERVVQDGVDAVAAAIAAGREGPGPADGGVSESAAAVLAFRRCHLASRPKITQLCAYIYK